MPLHVSPEDMALRLLLTMIAGVILGFNRESGGHAAGFRTTILDLNAQVQPLGYRAHFVKQNTLPGEDGRQFAYEVEWKQKASKAPPSALLEFLDQHYQVHSVEIVTETADHRA